MGSRSRRLLNQSTHSRVANSTASKLRHGPIDHLGLVEAVDGFDEGIVIGISDTADRGLHACFSQALGIFDRDVLAAPVAMVHKPAAMDRPPIVQCLLQRIEHEARMRRARGPPAHDPAGVGIDDEGDVDEAGPGRDIGEVGEPQDIRSWRLENRTAPKHVRTRDTSRERSSRGVRDSTSPRRKQR
jgi:hypothetical protein